MGYSKWKKITEPSHCYEPAVYKIRLKDNEGFVVSIDRFLGKDKKGILCIGKTKNMETRRKKFVRGIQHGKAHSEARLIYLIKTYCKKFQEKYSDPKYEYSFEKVLTKEEAERKETQLIKDYIKQYGEAPPFNSAIPKRFDREGWIN
jgi:hypothetical protein